MVKKKTCQGWLLGVYHAALVHQVTNKFEFLSASFKKIELKFS